MNTTSSKKKRNLRSNKGVALIVFVGIIVLILAVAFTGIYFIFFGGENVNEQEIANNPNTVTKEEQVKKIRSLGMDARIVSSITEDEVPIPDGFSYVQGNIKTGLIVKSNKTEIQYLFIPYDENFSSDTSEYYKKVKNAISMDTIKLCAMEKYGGFYVELNSMFKMSDLKTIDENNYKFQYEQLQYIDDDVRSINAHMLYLEEIALINHYIQSKKIDLGNNTIGVQALVIEVFSEVNPAELITKTVKNQNVGKLNNQNVKIVKTNNAKSANITKVANQTGNISYVYMTGANNPLYNTTLEEQIDIAIPVPMGFDYATTSEGAFLIQDKNNKNLIYIWVPFDFNLESEINNAQDVKNYIDRVKTGIRVRYNDYFNHRNNKVKETILTNIERAEEDLSGNEWKELKGLLDSINAYHGFYISQAELSYDDNGSFMNIARGMVNSTVTGTADGGDYYRVSSFGKKDTEEIYKKMKDKAKDVHKGNNAVNSHLMWGIEYNMTLMWILDTTSSNEVYQNVKGENVSIEEVVWYDSTNIGKYSNSGVTATSEGVDIRSLHEIWGLGGNLDELSREIIDGKRVGVGGSYYNTGEGRPMATRHGYDTFYMNLSEYTKRQDTIGMRTALYVNPEATQTYTEGDEFNYSVQDSEKEEIFGIDFELVSDDVKRYVCAFEGAKLYEEPKTSAKVISELKFAKQVKATKIATDIVKEGNKEITWIYAKIEDEQGKTKEGYINANDITTRVHWSDDVLMFVLANKGVPRYYRPSETKLYTNSVESERYYITNDEFVSTGAIRIVGKSIDPQNKWSLFVYNNGTYGYVLSEKLKSSPVEDNNNNNNNNNNSDNNNSSNSNNSTNSETQQTPNTSWNGKVMVATANKPVYKEKGGSSVGEVKTGEVCKILEGPKDDLYKVSYRNSDYSSAIGFTETSDGKIKESGDIAIEWNYKTVTQNSKKDSVLGVEISTNKGEMNDLSFRVVGSTFSVIGKERGTGVGQTMQVDDLVLHYSGTIDLKQSNNGTYTRTSDK